MITAIILTKMLNVGEISAVIPEKPKLEARKRGKGKKRRNRGGSGLR